MPRKTSPETVARIVAAWTEHHAGPVRLAAVLGLAASTIAAVLARAGLPRLTESPGRGRAVSDQPAASTMTLAKSSTGAAIWVRRRPGLRSHPTT